VHRPRPGARTGVLYPGFAQRFQQQHGGTARQRNRLGIAHPLLVEPARSDPICFGHRTRRLGDPGPALSITWCRSVGRQVPEMAVLRNSLLEVRAMQNLRNEARMCKKTNTREVVVVSAARTAIGAYGGSLKDTPPTKLAALVVKETLARA